MKTYKIIGEDGKVKDFTPSTNEEQKPSESITTVKNTVEETEEVEETKPKTTKK